MKIKSSVGLFAFFIFFMFLFFGVARASFWDWKLFGVKKGYQQGTTISSFASSSGSRVDQASLWGLFKRRRAIKSKIHSSSTVPFEEKNIAEGLAPGDYNFNLKFGGLARKYLLHVPESYKNSKSPSLVLAFHGGMGTAEIMSKNYEWTQKSDKEGFVVAFPNGTSQLPSGKFATWNAGNCCGYAVQSNSNDVGFVKAVIEDIKKKINIDKIFATGMSNGGMLSYRLACEMSDTFSAIAGVSGTDNYDGCAPQNPISIMHIHGLKDDHVLFDGGCGPECRAGSETNFVSVPNTISKWLNRNSCDKNPQTVSLNENAYYELYSNCKDGVKVKLIVVKNGGHSWPGVKKSSNPLEKNAPSQAISATNEIWDFFTGSLTK